jgi:hypothetical protein
MPKFGPKSFKEMSVAEAIEEYPHEWILMELTRPDTTNDLGSVGVVVFRAPDRVKVERVSLKFVKQRANAGLPQQHHYIFAGMRPATTGEEVRRALLEMREKGLVGGMERW